MGEQGPELLRAVSEAYECGRQVLNLLTSFYNAKQALTPSMQIVVHLETAGLAGLHRGDAVRDGTCSVEGPPAG